MAGKCMMLEKKLHELESEVADVVRLPLGSTPAAEQMPFDDIKERIEFLEKLRSAEAESQQLQDSDQLRSIDERLALVKATFFDWNRSRNCGFDDDTQSVCSDCTQSHGLLRESEIMPTRDVENFSGHKLSESDQTESESESESESEAQAEAEGRKWSEIGKYCGVFGCGMIAGVTSMVVKLYLLDYLIEDEYYSIPPT